MSNEGTGSPVRPTVVLLHALGLSGRSWAGVVEALGDGYDCVALDLPGFGANAGSSALTVEQTTAWVADRVRDLAPDRWLLVGHSMGGKIAAVLTAWAEAGEHGLTAPDGLVLVDASPPSPEPMSEQRRASMDEWAASGVLSAEHAARFVDANAPHPASARLHDEAVEDVQRTDPVAWAQWLERGSLEDWSDAVGVLRTPAVLVASAEGGDLGPDAQRELNGPHHPDAPVVEVAGAGHFVVLEQPQQVAHRIAELWGRVSGTPVLPPAFARLIASDRVSARTRGILLDRLREPEGPRALSPAQRTLLAAVLARVLPQRGTDLDLAGRLDVELAKGRGDGWRFADLPPDADAWRTGLDTVAAVADGFAALPAEEQDVWVGRFSAGDAGSADPALFDGDRMALWFQDVRAEAVRVWLSHPAAQAWIRYDGFADGGDGTRKQGFLRTHAGERESWQRDWRTGEERA